MQFITGGMWNNIWGLIVLLKHVGTAHTRAVQNVSWLVLFRWQEQAPRNAASWEHVVAHLDLFALGPLTVAFLILMWPQIKKRSVCVAVTLRITKKMKQQVHTKFYQNLGKSCTETYNMIKTVFREDSMNHIQVLEWFHWFKEGQTSGEQQQVQSKTKMLLTVSFDLDGVVHHEFAPEGHTVNTEYYLKVLWCLHNAICHMWPEKWL
jgi:hypothetical protein